MRMISAPKARAFCERPSSLRAEIFDKESRVYELRTLAESCTSRLSPAPGGHKDRRLEELFLEISALEEEIRRLEQDEQEALLSLIRSLSLLKDPMQIRLLTKHYVSGLTLSAIASEEHFSLRYIEKQLQAAALALEARLEPERPQTGQKAG